MAVSRYAGCAPSPDVPYRAGAVELGVVRHLECGTQRSGRLELAERPRRTRDGQVDDLDEAAAVDPQLRAVGLDEVRDVTRAAAAAGQAERKDRAHDGRRPVRDADDVHDRADVLRFAVVDDDQRVPAQVDVLVLEVGQRESPDDHRRIGLRDVEHGDAAPAAHVRVVVLEVHSRRRPRDVRHELDVARGGKRRGAGVTCRPASRPGRRRQPRGRALP